VPPAQIEFETLPEDAPEVNVMVIHAALAAAPRQQNKMINASALLIPEGSSLFFVFIFNCF
jgi:hypothetical protein